MTRPLFIGSEIYRGSTYGRVHPLAIPRVSTVMDLSRALGWLPDAAYRTSPRARPKALMAYHTPRYIAAVQQAEASQTVSTQTRDRHGLGTLSNPIFPEMFRRPATSVGGALLGAEIVARGGVAYAPGGGTHHGLPDRANGFCYFNDPVLAIKALRRFGMTRVAYVDVDAHHCDGVEPAFHGDPQVRLFSTHEERRWPFTGQIEDDAGGSAFNLPLPRDLNDSEFSLVLEQALLPVVAGFRPDAIVLQCGADAVGEDPLSRLRLSNTMLWKVVREMQSLCPRLLVLGGGGYNPWSVARAWTGVWGTLTGQDMPDRLPIAAQQILRNLTWARSAGRNPPEHWFSTLQDTPRPGPIRAQVVSNVHKLVRRLTSEI